MPNPIDTGDEYDSFLCIPLGTTGLEDDDDDDGDAAEVGDWE